MVVSCEHRLFIGFMIIKETQTLSKRENYKYKP